jgi:hypothetical protein
VGAALRRAAKLSFFETRSSRWRREALARPSLQYSLLEIAKYLTKVRE